MARIFWTTVARIAAQAEPWLTPSRRCPIRKAIATGICSDLAASTSWRSMAAACAGLSRWLPRADRGAAGRTDGKEIRLGDHFDLIGGTSTGAIIAGALALGHRIEEVKDFYLRLAPYAFKRQRWHIPILQAKFDARGLRKQIEDVVGEPRLCRPRT